MGPRVGTLNGPAALKPAILQVNTKYSLYNPPSLLRDYQEKRIFLYLIQQDSRTFAPVQFQNLKRAIFFARGSADLDQHLPKVISCCQNSVKPGSNAGGCFPNLAKR